MNKNLTIGIAISLIAGVAVGYYVLPVVFPVQAAGTGKTQYCVSNSNSIAVGASMETLPSLSLTFATETGDVILVTYTCRLLLNPTSSPGFLGVYFYALLDELPVMESELSVGAVFDSDATSSQSVTFRYQNSALAAGTHAIAIQAQGYGNLSVQYRNVTNNVLSLEVF